MDVPRIRAGPASFHHANKDWSSFLAPLGIVLPGQPGRRRWRTIREVAALQLQPRRPAETVSRVSEAPTWGGTFEGPEPPAGSVDLENLQLDPEAPTLPCCWELVQI